MSNKNTADLVGKWKVPLSEGVHIIEFEHGTISGKRVIYVDNKEIYRENFVFKLVGRVPFTLFKKVNCKIVIETDGYGYSYTLFVNGKDVGKFAENQNKILHCWIVRDGDESKRVTLEKDTLDVYVNADKIEITSEFTDEGTEMHFMVGDHNAFIQNISSGVRQKGIIHKLYVDEIEMNPANINDK